MKKPKRVNEVVYVAANNAGGCEWESLSHEKRHTQFVVNLCPIRTFKDRGPFRIARCRLVEVPKKKRKVKP